MYNKTICMLLLIFAAFTQAQGRHRRDRREGGLGPRGLAGPKGPQGEKGCTGKALSGVNYNGCGRTNCARNASIVYTGLMASGYHNHYGGGSNFLCLTNNSNYDKLLGSPRHLTTHIYTAEVKSRGSQMMIPATNECPAGWTREYYGYLMSSLYSGKHSTEFVCIDADPEVAPGHKRGSDGAQLYVVAEKCGALPCKPYIINYELTCVVCTK